MLERALRVPGRVWLKFSAKISGTGQGRVLVLLLGSALLLLAGWFLPVVTPPLMAILAAASLYVIATRVSPDPFLRRVTMVNYVARVGVAIALFFISYLHLPILVSYQIGGGFWQFGPDAHGYHQATVDTVEAIRIHLAPPQARTIGEGGYFYLLIGLYQLFGIQPLNGLILNGWAGGGIVLLAYALGRRLGGEKAGRRSAVILGFWPSSFMWSTQLLKDTVVLFLVLVVCHGAVVLLQGIQGKTPFARLSKGLAACIGILIAMICLNLFHFYVPMGMFLAASMTILPLGLLQFIAISRWEKGVAALALYAAIGFSIPLSRMVNIPLLFMPRNPEGTHLSVGNNYFQQGDLAKAIDEYQKALSVNPLYKEACFNLAMTYVQFGKIAESEKLFETYAMIARNVYPRVDRVEPEPFLEVVSRKAQKSEIESRPSEGVRLKRFVVTPRKDMPQMFGAEVSGKKTSDLIVQMPMPASKVPTAVAKVPRVARVPQAREAAPAAKAEEAPVEKAPEGVPLVEFEGIERKSGVQVAQFARNFATRFSKIGQELPTIREVYFASGRGEDRVFRTWGVLDLLRRIRLGFIQTGGKSVDAEVQNFTTLGEVVTFLPKALFNVFFFPAPWQALGRNGGLTRLLGSFESALTFLLLPAMVLGSREIIVKRKSEAFFLVVYSLGLAVVMGLAIGNLGILFRKKLLVLYPLLVLAMLGDPLSISRPISNLMRRAKFSRPTR